MVSEVVVISEGASTRPVTMCHDMRTKPGWRLKECQRYRLLHYRRRAHQSFRASCPSHCAQVYIDVLESVNLLMSSNGTVLRNDVSGKVIMKTILSGEVNETLRAQLGDSRSKWTAMPPSLSFRTALYGADAFSQDWAILA